MITSFAQVIEAARSIDTVPVAVAGAEDPHVLQAVIEAKQKEISDAILVGHRPDIEAAIEDCGCDPELFPIEAVEGGLEETAARTVDLILQGKAASIMKGYIDTSILLKAVLAQKKLRTERFMGVLGIIEPPSYGKLLFLTDGGFIIHPSLEQKMDLIRNGVELVKKLGIPRPKVAAVCAVEKVNEKMPDTLEAAELARLNREGVLEGCLVEGPLGFDNAISAEAARRKKVQGEVPGDADILLFPDLVSANSVYKAMGFLAGLRTAGYLAGAKVPIIITSRADSSETKLNSLAMAAFASAHES